MLSRLFAAALAAGLVAAALITVVEAFTTTPMILEAEAHEPQAHAHTTSANQADQAHDDTAWAPENGVERHIATLLANAVTAIAFALLVAVGLTVGRHPPDIAKGLMIAGGGFFAFTLAPVLGLPPELPGMPAADLAERQIWWTATVALSGGGLALLAWNRNLGLTLAAIVMLIAPHVWGAPHPATDVAPVSAVLAARFAAASIVVSALLWGLLGLLTPLFFSFFQSRDPL